MHGAAGAAPERDGARAAAGASGTRCKWATRRRGAGWGRAAVGCDHKILKAATALWAASGGGRAGAVCRPRPLGSRAFRRRRQFRVRHLFAARRPSSARCAFVVSGVSECRRGWRRPSPCLLRYAAARPLASSSSRVPRRASDQRGSPGGCSDLN
ncbi:hypothetical protein EVAR_47377_1 [Eumeta japonica]|uniref:Uncharacterized protein n=1 Tax=Eumeta variegata TaxID=151549 RepID=A0A4C1WWR1_EUMVA|nr:hypothetical protein EVAR_47377_1 [Eumeta japonica]